MYLPLSSLLLCFLARITLFPMLQPTPLSLQSTVTHIQCSPVKEYEAKQSLLTRRSHLAHIASCSPETSSVFVRRLLEGFFLSAHSATANNGLLHSSSLFASGLPATAGSKRFSAPPLR